jgi:Bacillus competence pheromone ComX
MLKQMVAYLQGNKEILSLVRNGQASLVGVTPVQQKAILEVIGGNRRSDVQPRSTWW